MALDLLSPEEREVIRRAMEATFRYFDVDFRTRIGISAQAMRSLLTAWPNIDDTNDDSNACLAINNSLNDLLHGVGISERDAEQLVGVSRAEMQGIHSKWVAARGWKSTGVQ